MLGSDGQLFKSLPLELLAQFRRIELKVRTVERAFDRHLSEAHHTHEEALLPVFQYWNQRDG